MSGNRLYYVELRVGLEFQGDEIPDEETLIAPIKEYAKNHIKHYKKTTRIVLIDSNISETEYDEAGEG
jgi:hypothetical protein